jgi:putative addiction module component (TIGR02574 family)
MRAEIAECDDLACAVPVGLYGQMRYDGATTTNQGNIMAMTLDMLESEVLNLSPPDRAHLLDRLIGSLHTDEERDAAWEWEAKRRHDEVASGQVSMIPGETVFAELAAELAAELG